MTGATGEWAPMYSITTSSSRSPVCLTLVPSLNAVYPSPPVNMKSLVTKRMVSVGPTGVSTPPAPTFSSVSITGTWPLQWNRIRSPEICGVRPVPPATSPHGGLKPFSSAAVNWAPVSVSITVELPNGSTANTWP